MRSFTRTTWYDPRYLRFRPHYEHMSLAAQDSARTLRREWRGLSYYANNWAKGFEELRDARKLHREREDREKRGHLGHAHAAA